MSRAVLSLLKWLVIPISLAAVGYYFVGPKIGQVAPLADSEKTSQAMAPTHAETDTPTDSTSYPAPDVTVTKGPQAVERPRRKHKRPTPSDKDATAQPDSKTPPDQGGSGGAATTGGDAGGSGGTDGGGSTGGDTGGTNGLIPTRTVSA